MRYIIFVTSLFISLVLRAQNNDVQGNALRLECARNTQYDRYEYNQNKSGIIIVSPYDDLHIEARSYNAHVQRTKPTHRNSFYEYKVFADISELPEISLIVKRLQNDRTILGTIMEKGLVKNKLLGYFVSGHDMYINFDNNSLTSSSNREFISITSDEELKVSIPTSYEKHSFLNNTGKKYGYRITVPINDIQILSKRLEAKKKKKEDIYDFLNSVDPNLSLTDLSNAICKIDENFGHPDTESAFMECLKKISSDIEDLENELETLHCIYVESKNKNSNSLMLVYKEGDVENIFDIFVVKNNRKTSIFPTFSLGVTYPISLEASVGLSNRHFFGDVFFNISPKVSDDIYVYSKSGDYLYTQNYHFWGVGGKFGYLWNIDKQKKWQGGAYAKFGVNVFNGTTDAKINGASVFYGAIGGRLEWHLTKWLSLYGNLEGKLNLSKSPSSNLDIMNECCPDIKNWIMPFGVSLGVKFNISKK